MAGETAPAMAATSSGRLRGLGRKPGPVLGRQATGTLGHHHGGDGVVTEEVGQPLLHLGGFGAARQIRGLLVGGDLADPAE